MDRPVHRSEISLKNYQSDFSGLSDSEHQELLLTALTYTSPVNSEFTVNAKQSESLDSRSFTLADLKKIVYSMPRPPKLEIPPGLYILSGTTLHEHANATPDRIFGIPLREVYHPFVSSHFRLFTTSAEEDPWYDLTRSTVIAIPIQPTEQATDSRLVS